MPLNEHFKRSGEWLFRHRGTLPLIMAAPMLWAASQFDWPWHDHHLQELWEYACISLTGCGFALRVITVGFAPRGTSGRNTRRQIADWLNTTGCYSVVRHPLYVANFIMMLGFVLVWHSMWLTIVFSLAFWLYYERIMFAEEAFLRSLHGEAYIQWASRTPAVVPRLSLWQPPTLSFSLRSAMRREYSTVLLITTIFFSMEVVEHYIIEHRLVFQPFYVALAAMGVATFLLLRTLKRHTSLLRVEGR